MSLKFEYCHWQSRYTQQHQRQTTLPSYDKAIRRLLLRLKTKLIIKILRNLSRESDPSSFSLSDKDEQVAMGTKITQAFRKHPFTTLKRHNNLLKNNTLDPPKNIISDCLIYTFILDNPLFNIKNKQSLTLKSSNNLQYNQVITNIKTK